jgi:hypothetical protein
MNHRWVGSRVANPMNQDRIYAANGRLLTLVVPVGRSLILVLVLVLPKTQLVQVTGEIVAQIGEFLEKGHV